MGLQLPMPAATLPCTMSEHAPCKAVSCTICTLTAGLCTQVTVPFLRSEYGKDYDYEAPVKLLDAMMHAQAERRDQQVRCLFAALLHCGRSATHASATSCVCCSVWQTCPRVHVCSGCCATHCWDGAH